MSGRLEDIDYGALAQQTAIEHWAAVQAAEDCANGDCDLHPDNPGACESPALGIGCNACDVCMVREVLAAAWPIFEQSVLSLARYAAAEKAPE